MGAPRLFSFSRGLECREAFRGRHTVEFQGCDQAEVHKVVDHQAETSLCTCTAGEFYVKEGRNLGYCFPGIRSSNVVSGQSTSAIFSHNLKTHVMMGLASVKRHGRCEKYLATQKAEWHIVPTLVPATITRS